jgi:glycosyltransferase involved in cell wall biosynthesis
MPDAVLIPTRQCGRHGELMSPVSFVIPAHNEQDYLPGTLTALKAAAITLELEHEIIVVNDDSTDDTANVARDYGATVVDVSLRNIGAVRNAGARHSKYERLFFVDADTVVPAETLRLSLLALSSGCVGGGAHVALSDEAPIPLIKWLMFLMMVLVWQILGGWAAGCYMFCRREVFFEFGGFDENYYAAEELFFSRNLKLRGRFQLVKHPVITSARKLHHYTVWQLLRFLFAPLARVWAPLRSRKGLEILYKDPR